ncbi:MAG: xanthine dehydrogenase family protein molybdopterin-binding subunit [Alphaproteobacteria bacterium]|nr:xanthine dehydrogenase family protein molybdopterin-binding subunit [Alphaproteobacteria bacterium]
MGFQPSRRFAILSGLAAAGTLAVGYALTPFSTLGRARQIAAGDGDFMPAAWLRLTPDNKVTVFVPHGDMGQGTHTALAMMAADEMDADWTLVATEQAPADMAFANGAFAKGYLLGDMSIPQWLNGTTEFFGRKIAEFMNIQVTGGSTAIRLTGALGMRKAGAAARAMLVRAAAEGWGVPESEIAAKASVLTHAASKRSATYGEMAGRAAGYDTPDAPLKAKADYTISGTPRQRLDIPAKVDGTAQYGIDVRLPGMLFAAALCSPVAGGRLKSVDEAPARAMRGVSTVVKMDDAVVVVADNTWRARVALEALKPEWDDGANGSLSSDSIHAGMNAALDKGSFSTDFSEGDAEAAIKGAPRVVEASYKVPFLAHATMEPMNAAAWVHDGKVEVWSGIQDGLGGRAATASLADVPMDAVVMHQLQMGGGFGRRAFSPVLPSMKARHIAQAIAASKATGKPVLVTWSREQDMTQDYYREASVARMKAGLTADGRIAGWLHSFTERHDPPEATRIDYDVADRTARYVSDTNPMPWGPWRSVDHTHQAFYIESFIDELAHAAGQDPLAFRLAHLANAPRHKAALERVAQMAGWGTNEPGRAKGIAMREAFGTIVAQIAEATIGDDGRARITRMWTAADPGEVVNPATFKAQMTGGAIYGLTAALYGSITVEKGRVVEENFPDYEMVRMADAPRHEVAIIESGAKIGGAGEPGTAPVAAAVANAVFALTGQRIRELPLRQFDLKSGGKIARL